MDHHRPNAILHPVLTKYKHGHFFFVLTRLCVDIEGKLFSTSHILGVLEISNRINTLENINLLPYISVNVLAKHSLNTTYDQFSHSLLCINQLYLVWIDAAISFKFIDQLSKMHTDWVCLELWKEYRIWLKFLAPVS